MSKRYLYIILGIVIAAIAAILIIFFLKKNPSTSGSFFGLGGGSLPQVGTQGAGSGTQGTSGEGGGTASSTASGTIALGQGAPAQTFGIISNGPVLDYYVDTSDIITTIAPDGTIAIVQNGTRTVISSTTIPDVISASFSYDGKKVLVSSGDPRNPYMEIFDATTRTWISGPTGAQSPQWSPANNYKIAYLAPTSAGGLALMMIDAANPKKAPVTQTPLMATDLSLQWVSPSSFVLADKPTLNNNGSIWLFNASTGTIAPLVYESAGAEGLWYAHATSSMGLVFKYNVRTPGLYLTDGSGATLHSMSFLTLPSKCTFYTALTPASPGTGTSTVPYLYCGIPADQGSLPSAGLPDSYNMMSLFTSDELAGINLATGQETVLRTDVIPHVDATDLKVVNGILFFISRYDQKLYALTLPAS